MRVFAEPFPKIDEPFVICIGKFDGLHIGHRLILDTLMDEARAKAAVSVAYSFEPRNGTPLLTTREEKLNLFSRLGIQCVIQAELSDGLMAMTAEQFIEQLSACGRLKAVAVGQDFRFGRGATGDVELLKKLGNQYGFDVHAIAQVAVDSQPVSSTLIREKVKTGDVECAALLLGREYSLYGEVIRGRQLARQLGYRTANIQMPEGKVIPAYGVYACRVDALGSTWPTIVNIGVKPTINGTELLVESHLLGFEGDLYGKKITVRLVKRIRDEIRFEGLEQLKQQLNIDKMSVLNIIRTW